MRTTKKEGKKKLSQDWEKQKINRKEALKKTGYIAAATMMILLSTPNAANASPAPPPGW